MILAACMLFVTATVSYGDDELSPEAVKEAAKQGFARADRDVEKQQLEKAQAEGKLTKEGTERLKKIEDMNKDYENWKKNPFSDKKGVDVAERARRARAIQHILEKLKNSKDPGMQKAAWEQELKKLEQGSPELPELPPPPSATTSLLPTSQGTAPASVQTGAPSVIPASQSGFIAFASATTTDVGATSSLKGHMTMVGTAIVQKQTTTKLNLDSLAHIEERGTHETPEHFQQYWRDAYGKTDFSKLTLTGWSAWDARPPKVTAVDAKNSFSLDGIPWRDTFSPRLNLSYGFDYVSAPLEKSTIGRHCEVTFNTNPSFIAGIGLGADISSFQTSYMNHGMINRVGFGWRVWYPPFAEVPTILSGQISEEGYHQVGWEGPFKQFMVYGELNPGTVTKPLLQWKPETWPSSHATPIPRFRIPLISSEEP
jgi:uncharacterized Zn-binding protein involved in type VI secretion